LGHDLRQLRLLRGPMTHRILAALLSIALASTAGAQEEPKKKKKMTFGEETVRDDTKARARLQAAVDLYKRGLFETAAMALSEIADSPSAEFETVKDDAEYYLAVSLYQLGFYQSTLNYFDRVATRGAAHPHHAQTVKWLALLAHRLKAESG